MCLEMVCEFGESTCECGVCRTILTNQKSLWDAALSVVWAARRLTQAIKGSG